MFQYSECAQSPFYDENEELKTDEDENILNVTEISENEGKNLQKVFL